MHNVFGHSDNVIITIINTEVSRFNNTITSIIIITFLFLLEITNFHLNCVCRQLGGLMWTVDKRSLNSGGQWLPTWSTGQLNKLGIA